MCICQDAYLVPAFAATALGFAKMGNINMVLYEIRIKIHRHFRRLTNVRSNEKQRSKNYLCMYSCSQRTSTSLFGSSNPFNASHRL